MRIQIQQLYCQASTPITAWHQECQSLGTDRFTCSPPLPPLAVSVPPTSLSSCPSGSCLAPSLIDTTHAIVTKYIVKIIWIYTRSALRITISHKSDAKASFLDLTGWTALRGITSCVGYHASVLLATNFLNTSATEICKAPWTGSIEARGDFASYPTRNSLSGAGPWLLRSKKYPSRSVTRARIRTRPERRRAHPKTRDTRFKAHELTTNMATVGASIH